VVVLVVFALLACAGAFVVTRLLALRIPVAAGTEAAANLNPLEAVALEVYLGLHAGGLNEPFVSGAEPVIFEVAQGSSAGAIGDELVRRGLISNAGLFRRYVHYVGLDSALEAGRFEISAAMTIPEIALALTEALSPDVTVQLVEGRRLEEIAAAIDATEGLSFTGADFAALVGPGAERPQQFDFLQDLPPGASLEGFLFPDTYRLGPDATAADLRDRMLENFDAHLDDQMRAGIDMGDLALYEVVTMASIVEREAVIPNERPLIAGVYLNRLGAGMTLDADPTVQYAMSSANPALGWWPQLTLSDYTDVQSPYNTYLNVGLPPGPIASPGIDAIAAVINPEASEYLYFRACDDSGYHLFSLTFEEHLSKCD
jgi:UPF0755 protein